METQSYLEFRSESQRVPYTFLYPADWQVRETVEEDRVTVFMAGPRDPEDTFSVGFDVTLSPATERTPVAAMQGLLERFRQMSGFREIGRDSGIVTGKPAVEVEFTYTMPLPLNARKPQMKTIRNRYIMFLDSDGMLIELSYIAPDEMYDTWLPSFRTLVHTFRRTEGGEAAAFHSLIEVPDAAVVREATADYNAEEQTREE